MSINGKFVYSIELDTMQDAKDMVAIATKLKGKILLKSGTKFTINAKSLLGVISLGAKKDMTISIIAEGSDAEEAIAKLSELIDKGFDK